MDTYHVPYSKLRVGTIGYMTKKHSAPTVVSRQSTGPTGIEGALLVKN